MGGSTALTVTGAEMEWTIGDGGGIGQNGATAKPGEYYAFSWSLYRDTLTLSPVAGAISPSNYRLKPRHRISAIPSAKYLNQHGPPPANALG